MASDLGEEFGEGLAAGFGLFAVELTLFALFLAGEATTSTAIMALLTILVSLVSFAQSMAVGREKSEWFLAGFFIGGLSALYIAWQLSDPMRVPVCFGIATAIIGAIIGLYFKIQSER